MHLGRSLKWKLASVKPTPEELIDLDCDKDDVPSFFSYLLWRKSSFIVAAIPLAISAVMEYVSIADMSSNGRLSVAAVLSQLDSTILFILSVYGWKDWRKYSSSSLKLVYGAWLLSFGLSVLPLLFARSTILWNLSQALPAVLTLSYCAIRASLRLSLLEPAFNFASRLLLLFSVVHLVLSMLSLSAVKLLYRERSGILVAATVFLALSPWPYLLQRNIYLHPRGRDEKIKERELFVRYQNSVGTLLAVIWALVVKPQLVRDTLQLLFEAIGRVLITNIVVGDYLVQSLVEHWRIEKETGTAFIPEVEAAFVPFYRELHERKPDDDGEDLSDSPFSADIGDHEAFRAKVIDMETESLPVTKEEFAVTDMREIVGHEVFDYPVSDDSREDLGDKKTIDDDLESSHESRGSEDEKTTDHDVCSDEELTSISV